MRTRQEQGIAYRRQDNKGKTGMAIPWNDRILLSRLQVANFSLLRPFFSNNANIPKEKRCCLWRFADSFPSMVERKSQMRDSIAYSQRNTRRARRLQPISTMNDSSNEQPSTDTLPISANGSNGDNLNR